MLPDCNAYDISLGFKLTDFHGGNENMEECPCGSNLAYAECCEPVITGAQSARTAQELMRARYTAYTMADTEFIFNTTHPDHRDGYDHAGTKAWAQNSEWLGLEVLATEGGCSQDQNGTVEFIATFRNNGIVQKHHELGRFSKQDDTWLFTTGDMVKPKPVVSTKVGRNEPCPCGSGRKYKKCCGR